MWWFNDPLKPLLAPNVSNWTIASEPDGETVGRYDRKIATWIWNKDELLRLGIPEVDIKDAE